MNSELCRLQGNASERIERSILVMNIVIPTLGVVSDISVQYFVFPQILGLCTIRHYQYRTFSSCGLKCEFAVNDVSQSLRNMTGTGTDDESLRRTEGLARQLPQS
jgi:hypothetical protein